MKIKNQAPAPKPVKEKAERAPAKNPANFNPVTSEASVNIISNPAISDAQYGSINKSSVIVSFVSALNETFGEDLEFSKKDAETILNLVKIVSNDAVKTAHKVLHTKGLSSVKAWSSTGPLRVTAKANRKSSNPVLLKTATDYKNELIASGLTVEEAEANADYVRLVADWKASFATTDNAGKSVVKTKEATIEVDGTTAVDVAADKTI